MTIAPSSDYPSILLLLFDDASPENSGEIVDPSWEEIERAIDRRRDPDVHWMLLVRLDLNAVGYHERDSWEYDAAEQPKITMVRCEDDRGYIMTAELWEPELVHMLDAERHPDPNAEDELPLYLIGEVAMRQAIRTFFDTGTLDKVIAWINHYPPVLDGMEPPKR